MNAKTKIVVLHVKELIYTGIFVVLGILFVVLLIIMFSPKDNNISDTSSITETSIYIPGKYTTSLMINNTTIDVEVVVNSDEITSIALVNLEESVTTMYPLMEPALAELSSQILSTQSLDNISYSDDNKYTSMVLLNAIASSLEQAYVIDTNDSTLGY
ncbi:MAG: hypothetical protein R3Y24_01295 [Eubacteriales bacterium]